MLVYGDHNELSNPKELLAALDEQLNRVPRTTSGIDSHATLVGILIAAGELLQGLADAEFAERGEDKRSVVTDEFGEFVLQVAKAVCRSCGSGFTQIGQLPAIPRLNELPPQVELRTPEGFAFYAIYPEAYVQAARRLSLFAPPCVIGIRSIGTTLAAVVAAALDAPSPITVRPYGDPFRRQIAIAPELERELLESDAHYVIVDEGPGLSGSSFGAVADWLQERAVPLERIAFVPSHSGPLGRKASECHRRRWDAAQCVPAHFDGLPRWLGEWLVPLLGELDRPASDISGGEWRKWRYSNEDEWPAVNPAWERRKFLVDAGGAHFLVKFGGLGSIGERKLGMARALHSADFAPEPIGLTHGFLVERWCHDAQPLARGDKPIVEIGQYVGARARLFPASPPSGASLTELLEMCRRNISLALGREFAAPLDTWEPHLGQLSRRIVRVRTDNRLLPHEWLRSANHLLKTDALDHHGGHDLVGCQDMAWDVAGAIVEFELDAEQAATLIGSVEHSAGRHVDCELFSFYRPAYVAFRLGQAGLSADDCSDAESSRWEREASRYRRQLGQCLQSTTDATRPISLVG